MLSALGKPAVFFSYRGAVTLRERSVAVQFGGFAGAEQGVQLVRRDL